MNIVRIAVAAAVLGAAAASPVAAEGRLGGTRPPAVPADLEVDAAFTLYLKAHAYGSQNYICLPTASGTAWTFIGPQATLFQTLLGLFPQQVTTHFLSANPDEAGNPARATWQHSIDSSRVWAKAVKSSTDPNYVEPGAIPWLKLERAGSEPGPTGGSILSQAKFIQRINTSGGVVPATGCSQPADVGKVALVPYETDYLFYR